MSNSVDSPIALTGHVVPTKQHRHAEVDSSGPKDDFFFSPQKFTFSPQSIFNPLFLNKDSRIRKNRLSKLHYRFQRYTSLIKTV
jgi:hypothetical protein